MRGGALQWRRRKMETHNWTTAKIGIKLCEKFLQRENWEDVVLRWTEESTFCKIEKEKRVSAPAGIFDLTRLHDVAPKQREAKGKIVNAMLYLSTRPRAHFSCARSAVWLGSCTKEIENSERVWCLKRQAQWSQNLNQILTRYWPNTKPINSNISRPLCAKAHVT